MYWQINRVEARGVAERCVTCEHCGKGFVYRVVRTEVQEVPWAPGLTELARRTCEKELAKGIAKHMEPMSCPGCGWVQAEMTRELRRRFWGGLRKGGQFFTGLALGILALVGGWTLWLIMTHQLGARGGIDMDWGGLSLACAGGAVLGMGVIGMRILAAKVRYSRLGFMPRRKLMVQEGVVELIAEEELVDVAVQG